MKWAGDEKQSTLPGLIRIYSSCSVIWYDCQHTAYHCTMRNLGDFNIVNMLQKLSSLIIIICVRCAEVSTSPYTYIIITLKNAKGNLE